MARLADVDAVRAAEQRATALHSRPVAQASRQVAPPPERVDEHALRQALERDALDGVRSWRFRERRAGLEAAARAARHGAAWTRQEGEAQHCRAQEALDAAWEKLSSGDRDSVQAALAGGFRERGIAAKAVETTASRVWLRVAAPRLGSLPERKTGYTPSGRPSVKKRTKTELNELHRNALASQVLAAVRVAFAAAPSLEQVDVVADDQSRTGPELVVLYWGRFDRVWARGVRWDSLSALEEIFVVEHGFATKGRTEEIVPVSDEGDPGARRAIAAIAADAGRRVCEAGR
jgi:hypothetical protein